MECEKEVSETAGSVDVLMIDFVFSKIPVTRKCFIKNKETAAKIHEFLKKEMRFLEQDWGLTDE